MARIQYRPSAQRKGFSPNKLSTEGISRMREESNRIIQGLEENRRAEAEQRAVEARAMESDAAYAMRVANENFATQQQNLQNQQNQLLANIKGEQAQADIDSRAATSVVDSLVEFSDTLGKEAARRTKQMIEDQTELGRLSVRNVDPERLEEYIRAENARIDGSIALMGEISANAVESGEDRLETIKNLAGIPGMSGYAAQAAMNELSLQLYGDSLQSRLVDGETKYTSSSGNEFTGLQASRDVNLMRELQEQTERDVLKFLNITEPLQVRKGLEAIRKFNGAIDEQTRKRNLEDKEEEVRQLANAAFRTNNFEGFTAGYQYIRSAFGLKAAHDRMQEEVANPNSDLEQIKKVKIDGKVWYENWSNRWDDGLAARNKAIANNLRVERQLVEEQDKAWVRSSLPAIQEAYNQNAAQASLLVQKRYRDNGLPIPQAIRNIETAAFAKNKAEVQKSFEQRQKFGILDLPFVNSIQDPTLQKKAREAYEQQQLTRYGPEALGIKKGLRATARKLTGLDPNEEQGSATTFLVQARLESEYLKQLNLTNDPLKALEVVNSMVDAAYNKDKSSPFYFVEGVNQRTVFPNIQSSDREVAERRVYIDKQLIAHGANIVNKPFALADSNQMDATYASSLVGITQYPPGFLQAADRLKLKPSELYNAARKTNNLATGENKPLLTPTPVNQLVESAPAWMQKLFNSGEDSMVRRGVASANGNLPRRGSFKMSQTATYGGAEQIRALDTIALTESGSAGYDAVNQGGTDGGTKTLGYSGAYSQMPTARYNLPLTEMTLGQVLQEGDPRFSTLNTKQFQNAGGIHAAGRYQIINSTLRGLVERHNLPLNAKFSPELQDFLALSLLNSGGDGQWVGPTASDRSIIKAGRGYDLGEPPLTY